MALLLLVLPPLGMLPVAPAQALSLPWVRPDPAAKAREGHAPERVLQEVAPPDAVQQLQAALAWHQPVVEIVSPSDDTVLPPGPWTLKLRVHDWPLVDGGALGLGPHLVVQLDQEPPRLWTQTEGLLPELSPGSHRLTVYAAQPWGEARRSPGAWQQIHLHRTAPNPTALPTRGSPQLLPVSPSSQVAGEPLLLDWLLLNAPLQDLRGSDSPWRLRVSINGDDVILDQQTPLWLRGWRSGPNAVRLELLDGRGDPLNPPFNSLVLEANHSPSAPRPRWLGARLSQAELAVLLGRTPPSQDPAREDKTAAEAGRTAAGSLDRQGTGAAAASAPPPEKASAVPEVSGDPQAPGSGVAPSAPKNRQTAAARPQPEELIAPAAISAGEPRNSIAEPPDPSDFDRSEADPPTDPQQGSPDAPSDTTAAAGAAPGQGGAEPLPAEASPHSLSEASAAAPVPPAAEVEESAEPDVLATAGPPAGPAPDGAAASADGSDPGSAGAAGGDATGHGPSARAAAAALLPEAPRDGSAAAAAATAAAETPLPPASPPLLREGGSRDEGT